MSDSNNTPARGSVSGISSAKRLAEIKRLELEREEINREIEKLLKEYKKLTGDKRAVSGAKKIGSTEKDYSFWHK